MWWLLSILLTAGPGAPPSDAPLSIEQREAIVASLLGTPERRVRSTDAGVSRLIAEGVRRSPTFASLVAAVSGTDVIVYVQRVADLPRVVAGRLILLPPVGGFRYLRVEVRSDLNAHELIALIGHELRHALEIAEDPTVRDTPTLVSLYRRIGQPTRGEHSFDTEAAQVTGRRVRAELAG